VALLATPNILYLAKPMSRESGRGPKSRSGRLLKSLLDGGKYSAAALADELSVTVDDINAYVTTNVAMPLKHQQCLALFVIEKVPALARDGHALKAQVAAAAEFEGGTTTTHSGPPARWPAKTF